MVRGEIVMNIFLKCSITIVFLFSFFSCASTLNQNNIVGIYKVSTRDCNGSSVQIESCKSIAFIEFVAGKFYKIADNEIAFVIWSGEKNTELLYLARKYNGDLNFMLGKSHILTGSDNQIKETIQFTSVGSGVYSIENYSTQYKKWIHSELIVEKASSKDVKNYTMEYPGNK